MQLIQPLELNNYEKLGFRRHVDKYVVDVNFDRKDKNWRWYIWSEFEGVNKFYSTTHRVGSANSREKAVKQINKWLVNKL